ncbi:glycosyl transferase [Sphingobacterium sp. B29]|uniref:glycosyltransferase family 2 protein n=1 Tax=Sphingobacterium sp. B29 TaxID=1933220 RepID=UPI0009588620|nr:glycosyltransferase family 2 protein [Sphingobacterium sp. B29]APU95301.1 glycosyl transferase [Sphingobacterium sp. B29]
MKISIITVCWNSEATIEKTIKSVESQDYPELEYIIVDGKSKDNTLNIIKQYPNVVSKWISEPDKGLYDAMNKGIDMATGDYIGIVNADDTFYDENAISKIVNFLKTNNIEASIGDIVQHREDGQIVRRYSAKNWSPEKLKIGFMPAHPAIFFRKEIFEKLGNYSLDFKIAADYELIIRFFLKQHISWKYSGITTHKMLMGGVSSSGYESYKKVSEEIIKALRMNEIPFQAWRIKSRIIWKIFGFLKRK